MLGRRLVTTLACAVALAGCAADDRPDARPAPAATTASPAPPSAPAETSPVARPAVPEPVLPPASKGRKAQLDLARYVVEAWAYALATNDASPLLEVSAGKAPCRGCEELDRELDRRARDGWSVYPFQVTLDEIRLRSTPAGTTASVRFDVPRTRSYFDDGTFRNTSPAHADSKFTVAMRREGRTYRLVAFSIA